MEISLKNADAYFGSDNHTMSAAWFAYTEENRAAAVKTARRVLERSLRRKMAEDQTDGDRRDDYAVYEQALYELRKRPMADAREGQPYPVAQDAVVAAGSEAVVSSFGVWADEALRWLGWNGVAVVRG